MLRDHTPLRLPHVLLSTAPPTDLPLHRRRARSQSPEYFCWLHRGHRSSTCTPIAGDRFQLPARCHPPSPPRPHSWIPLCSALSARLPGFVESHIASVYFKCFRCFKCMLQVFQIDIVKVDRDFAYEWLYTYVAKVCYQCFICVFRHMSQVCLSGCYIYFTHMLQVCVLDVSVISDICCKCFI
jgi:hypothetical protein